MARMEKIAGSVRAESVMATRRSLARVLFATVALSVSPPVAQSRPVSASGSGFVVPTDRALRRPAMATGRRVPFSAAARQSPASAAVVPHGIASGGSRKDVRLSSTMRIAWQ